jgi:DNA-binding response OmpR family regulator
MPQVGTSQVIRFATFEVDLQAQELRKGGLRLKLTGQPFQVLAILPGATRHRCYAGGVPEAALARHLR